MKKFLSSLAAVAAIAMVFPACDKDNGKNGNGENGTGVAEAVAGTYEGTFDMSVSGSSAGSENLGCTVTAVSDNTVDIALDEFSAMGTMTFSLTANGVTVTETADGYSLEGTIDTMSGETRVTGSVSGTIGKDKTASITFTFKPGAMPMDIIGVFTSPAASADEDTDQPSNEEQANR